MDVLHRLLHESHAQLTRWDVYQAEVESKSLQWGVVHTEAFFRENARLLEGKSGNFDLVRQLILLIRNASLVEPEVAAIACFDLGEFIRFYPNGKMVARRLGAREVLLPLIEHENVDLQMQAVTCLSKMLVQNWAATLR